MSDRDILLKLARVIIAVAWIDGEITNEEINCLKDLLFTLRRSGFDDVMQFSAQEWARLDMYIETPVGESERDRLVADLRDSISTPQQKQIALQALRNMMEADGLASESEQEAVIEISQAIESADTGMLGGLQKILGGAMQRRSEAVANAPNREDFFEDFLKNKVYYAVSQQLSLDGRQLDLSDESLRKLGLVGGLMSKIAQIDRDVKQAEVDRMVESIMDYWALSEAEALFVAEVAVSAVDVTYEIFRMMRELVSTSTVEERRKVLFVLFAVAAADDDLSFDETEEIRMIARGLELNHKDFIEAKLSVLGEE